MTTPCKIQLARSAGFCFGVKRAIKMARELAQSGGDIRMLGDIVHNETVIREMEHAGIRKIHRLGSGQGKTLLIRAHGASKSTHAAARKRGYTIADATCPMVHEIHRIVERMDQDGRRIIVIGDPKHDEVLGIIGQIRRKALVINGAGPIPEQAIRRIRRAAIVIQSTQNLNKIQPLIDKLLALIPDAKFFNTICKPTHLKQEEIKTMPEVNEVMIVIGSRTSANTQRLYEIAKAKNPRSYWIESADELKRAWFKGVRSVGVTAGASTPDETTRAVIAAIRQDVSDL